MPTTGREEEEIRVTLIDTNRQQVNSTLEELEDIFEDMLDIQFNYVENLIISNFRKLNISTVEKRCENFGANIKDCALLYSFYEFYNYLNLLVTTEIKYNQARDKLRNTKQYIFEQKVDLGETLLEQASELLAELNQITATDAREKLKNILLILRNYSIESRFNSIIREKSIIEYSSLEDQKEELKRILKKIQMQHKDYEKKKERLHKIKQRNNRF